MSSDERYLTVDEVGQRLSIKKSKAYELVNSEGFPLTRLGKKCLRINERELEAWLEGFKSNSQIH